MIRAIKPTDNKHLAKLIRDVLTEFGANKPGTVYYDETTDHLSEVFQAAGSRYFVLESSGKILGGAGIFPTDGLPADTCELVKMYLLPEARGKGHGRLLMEQCLDSARDLGYHKVYLETMPELKQALQLYAHFGFRYLDGPMGNSGHHDCDRWMIREV